VEHHGSRDRDVALKLAAKLESEQYISRDTEREFEKEKDKKKKEKKDKSKDQKVSEKDNSVTDAETSFADDKSYWVFNVLRISHLFEFTYITHSSVF
jgi:hypothetical protein